MAQENFTKSDFLSPKKLAKLLNEDPELVRKTMLQQFKWGTQILIGKNKMPRPLVHSSASSNRGASNEQESPLRLHPLGLERFKEILAALKDKSSEK